MIFSSYTKGKLKAMHCRLKVKDFKPFQAIKVEILRKAVDSVAERMLQTFVACSEKHSY